MIREGTDVKWKWGSGWAEGKVDETHTSKITRTISGSEVIGMAVMTTLPSSSNKTTGRPR